jgi:hypothetical protein
VFSIWRSLLVAAAIGLLGAPAAWAGASTTGPASATSRPHFAGTYNGKIVQSQPKAYTGHIHFVVAHGRLTDLRFRVGTLCGVAWAEDTDSPPNFAVKVSSTGAFSYKGTISGRKIRLKGTLKANKAQGTLFTSFPFGQGTCTMGTAAPFTATRSA